MPKLRTDILECKEQILKWVESNTPKRDIAKYLNCKISTLNTYLAKMGIDYLGQEHRKNNNKYISSTNYTKENGPYIDSWKLKQKLLNENIKKHECELCGLSTWLNKPIPLELHHIDGNRYNNKLENLQILCPNCHSMQENNCSKNIGTYHSEVVSKQHYCAKCGSPISRDTDNQLCQKCFALSRRVVERPNREKLKQEIKSNTFTALSKKYGVSDKAIVKWCKCYKLPYKASEIKNISDEDWKQI